MLCSQLQVLLVAFSASVLLANGAHGAPQTDILAELLRANVADGNEDLSRMLLLKIASDLMKGDNKVLPETDELGIHQEEERQLPLSQRERKAGCRNFFWKTFTSYLCNVCLYEYAKDRPTCPVLEITPSTMICSE